MLITLTQLHITMKFCLQRIIFKKNKDDCNFCKKNIKKHKEIKLI